MSGTRVGGMKTAEIVKTKHGDDFYSRIGRMGGSHTGFKGFAAMPREKRQEAGRKGGQNSSRLGVRNGEGKKRRTA